MNIRIVNPPPKSPLTIKNLLFQSSFIEHLHESMTFCALTYCLLTNTPIEYILNGYSRILTPLNLNKFELLSRMSECNMKTRRDFLKSLMIGSVAALVPSMGLR